MSRSLTVNQLKSLETIERCASCVSLLGTTFVMLTFLYSPTFRKPINRLAFYATLGNTACNVATLMSQSGIRAGKNSHLCQFQGFLIQMFLPADALWNLAIAINVYLTLFRKYNAQQLKSLEWKYHVMCYGFPFVVALVYLFIESNQKGKIYGPATLWCWISIEWVALRVALCYVPAWICILVAFSIYTMAGREIFMKRRELRAVSHQNLFQDQIENPFTNFKTTEIHITSELVPIPPKESLNALSKSHGGKEMPKDRGYDRYTVTIASNPKAIPPHTPNGEILTLRHQKAAAEANRAAWGYTKIAILFFLSLLITWVPSSINRVYSLVHPDLISVPFTFASGVVLPLMGFWNSVIYITTSWAACKSLICGDGSHRPKLDPRGRATRKNENATESDAKRSDGSVSDSMRALARENEV